MYECVHRLCMLCVCVCEDTFFAFTKGDFTQDGNQCFQNYEIVKRIEKRLMITGVCDVGRGRTQTPHTGPSS